MRTPGICGSSVRQNNIFDFKMINEQFSSSSKFDFTPSPKFWLCFDGSPLWFALIPQGRVAVKSLYQPKTTKVWARLRQVTLLCRHNEASYCSWQQIRPCWLYHRQLCQVWQLGQQCHCHWNRGLTVHIVLLLPEESHPRLRPVPWSKSLPPLCLLSKARNFLPPFLYHILSTREPYA